MNPLKALAAFIADISPKVRAGLNWGVLATLAVALLNSITPDMLAWAGPWEPILFSAVPVLVGQIAAWTKTDPLRAAGAAAAAAAPAPGVEVPDVPAAPTTPPAA